MRRILVTILLIIVGTHLQATPYIYAYNDKCAAAYTQYMSLHLQEGNAIVKQVLKEDPYNLMATYLSDYDDCFRLLFNGNRKDYEQCKSHIKTRIDLLDRGDASSPWQRLCKAGIYLRWAVIYIRFGDNMKAGTTFRKSYLLLKENRRLFPAFRPNDVYYGMEEAVVGTIPGEYKWIASLLGLKGNVRNGVSQLAQFINAHSPHDLFHREAVIYYTYLRFYLLSQQQESWDFFQKQPPAGENDLMHSFVKANLALNYRKADVALQQLQSAATMPGYDHFPIFDFEFGSALYYKTDASCIRYFQRFLTRYQGDIFAKEALQHMSCMSYLQQHTQLAGQYREKIKTTGSTISDADKQAQRFANTAIWPHPALFRTRLLTDGGYYRDALAIIAKYNAEDFNDVPYKLEYYFRSGRLYDLLEDDTKAITYYRQAIDIGRARPEHFAARSALQLGFMYEAKKKPAEALFWFRESMKMENTDFKNSIDQQAKAGIERLQGK